VIDRVLVALLGSAVVFVANWWNAVDRENFRSGADQVRWQWRLWWCWRRWVCWLQPNESIVVEPSGRVLSSVLFASKRLGCRAVLHDCQRSFVAGRRSVRRRVVVAIPAIFVMPWLMGARVRSG